MRKLLDAIREIVPLDVHSEVIISSKFEVERFRRGTILLEEGNVCGKLWFVESGTIRQYLLADGVEISKWFYVDGQWATSHFSYFEQQPAYDYLQVYEDATLYSITFEKEKELLENPVYLKYHLLLIRQYLARLNYFMKNYKQMTADDKYAFFLKNQPEIIQRIKLKDLASLIGISQETLSRIRTRV